MVDGETLARLVPAVASSVALALSLVGLYLQRRDRRPRLKVRVRYEYRLGPAGHSPGRSPGEAPGAGEKQLRIHDDSQENLYKRLGDFLIEHGLRYVEDHSSIRFSLSNEGEKIVYLNSVRLYLQDGTRVCLANQEASQITRDATMTAAR